MAEPSETPGRPSRRRDGVPPESEGGLEAPATGTIAGQDDELAGLIESLLDAESGPRAASVLLAQVKAWPDEVPLEWVPALISTVRKASAGDVVLEACWLLATGSGELRQLVAIEAAQCVLEWRHLRAASPIVASAIEDRRLKPSKPLVEALIQQLAPLSERPWAVPVELQRRDDSHTAAAVVAIHHRAKTMLESLVRSMLSSDDRYQRSQVASAVAVVVGESTESTALGYADLILEGLAPLHRHEYDEMNECLVIALAVCLSRQPDIITSRILERIGQLESSAAGLALHAFTRDEASEASSQPWRVQLVRAVADDGLGLDHRTEVAATLTALARQDPSAFGELFDALLGSLLRVCEQRAPIVETWRHEQEIGQLTLRTDHAELATRTMMRDIGQTLALAALPAPDGAARIGSFLSELDAVGVDADELKVALLGSLGVLGEAGDTAIVPVVYPRLLDPNSPRVRAAAAAALASLVRWHREVLPDDVLLAAAALLRDEYVAPSAAAVAIFTRAGVREPSLADDVLRSLPWLYQACAPQADRSHIVRDVADACLNLVRDHHRLLPDVTGLLWAMSFAPYRDAAEAPLQRLGWLARWHRAAQEPFLAAVLVYYRRFALSVSTGLAAPRPNSDDLFMELYALDPKLLREHGDALIEFARGVEGAPRYVAVLLLGIGDRRALEAWELAESALPEGGTGEVERARIRGIRQLIQAEAALEQGQVEEAAFGFEEAERAFEDADEAIDHLPFLEKAVAHRPLPWLEWIRLRETWVRFPDDVASWVDHVSELRRQLTRQGGPTAERDVPLHRLVESVLNAASFFAGWYHDVRRASPDALAQRDAAGAHMRDAATYARELGGEASLFPVLRDRLEALSERLPVLQAAAAVALIRDSLRSLPLPVPLCDLPIPQLWRAHSTTGGRPAWRPAASQMAVAEVRVARVRLTVDGEPPSAVFGARAGQLYDVNLDVELGEDPEEGIELRISHSSRLPRETYSFPVIGFTLEPGRRRYECHEIMRFDVPQSPDSAPVDIALLATLEGRTKHQEVHLLGERALTLHVGEPVPHSPEPVPQRFDYGDDFGWIRVDGEFHRLSTNRAMVIAKMHEIGEPVHETRVFEELYAAFNSRRIADVFRRSPLFETFVIPLGRGMYELKYYNRDPK